MTLFSLAPGSLLDPPLGDSGAFFDFHFALKFQRSHIPHVGEELIDLSFFLIFEP